MAGTALVKYVAKEAPKAKRASKTGTIKQKVKGLKEGRKFTRTSIHQSKRNGFYDLQMGQRFNPNRGAWESSGRREVTWVPGDTHVVGTTVHGELAGYAGRTRTRQVGVGYAKQVNRKGAAVKRDVGIHHNRYNTKKLKGRETTISLRPSLMGGWDDFGERKFETRTINGEEVRTRIKHYQPINGMNAYIASMVSLTALGAAMETSHVENKTRHQQFYTRKRKGKTQKVRNPNYMRRTF